MPSRQEKALTPLTTALTGRFNFKRTLTGKLVLRVEEDVCSVWPWSRGERRQRWRDAGPMDLAAPELRALMDLRTKPQQPPPRYPEAPQASPVMGDETAPAIPSGKPSERAWSLHRSPQ